jgi:hypothetical protein
LILFAALCAAPADAERIEVTVTGFVRTGVVAIGGETTGATITAKGITWELDFAKSGEARAASEKLDGKLARVTGELERREGVEIKERWIVTVTGVTTAEKNGDKRDEAKKGARTEAPPLDASVRREDSTIRFSTEGDRTVITIESAFGIDTAIIKRQSDHWPAEMIVRARLKGLESFKLGCNESAVQWSASREESAPTRVSHWRGREEVPIGNKHPLFTEAHYVAGDAESGYFEIPLPASFFANNPSEVTLAWIDFYR